MNKGKRNIDFKFARNWKKFMVWYDKAHSTAGFKSWEVQTQKIEESFEPSNPGIVDWKMLWKDFSLWYKETIKDKGILIWSEQKRQIETLMLNQLSELNKEQFVLVFLYKGKPDLNLDKLTYWEALAAKEELEGDSNGRGGDENIDHVSIVNLNKLIR